MMTPRHTPSRSLRIFLNLWLLLIGLWLPFSVLAEEATTGGGATTPAKDCSFDQFKQQLGGRESGGDYGSTNSFGYTGKYQFGESALQAVGMYSCSGGCPGKNQTWNGNFNYPGVNSIDDFKNNPGAQEEAMNRLIAKNQAQLSTNITYKGASYPPLSSYIGQNINGVTITESGLLAGCHLKGCAGLAACMGGGMSCTDGYGTNAYSYMDKFGGYNVGNGENGNSCNPSANTASPRAQTYGNPLCDENIKARVDEQINAWLARKNDFVTTNYSAPPALGQVANTPCMSKELQRISNQFGYAPTKMTTQVTGGLLSAGGPISGLMQKMMGAEFKSINQAANMMPVMQNFQSMASGVMGNLLGSLGLGDAFSSEVCGLMVDMLLKYVQCENPIKLPNLGNLFGSLNNLLPNNCAGQALKSTLMQSASMKSLQTTNQPIIGSPGNYALGSADSFNRQMGR